MVQALHDGDDISLFAFGTTLLRNRWRIMRWMFFGAAAATIAVYSRPALYLASTSFISQATDASQSSFATIAGQFGVAIPSGNQSQSPDFYVGLLKSRVILLPIVRDTLVVKELGGKRIAFLDLVKINGTTAAKEEAGVRLLSSWISTSIVKATGVIQVSVASRWPSVSLAVATALVNGVNLFNQRTRQGQATAERQFVEGRMAVAGSELRTAEDRLESFLKTNREFGSSPELTFERDRLQRNVNLQQQVFTLLTQSYENVRLREVRDTPLITVIEPPSVPATPEPRGRARSILIGLLLGGLIGTLMAIISTMVARRREQGDSEAAEFTNALNDVKRELAGSVLRLGKRVRK